jgi:hypothetical protein
MTRLNAEKKAAFPSTARVLFERVRIKATEYRSQSPKYSSTQMHNNCCGISLGGLNSKEPIHRRSGVVMGAGKVKEG